jgi:hypothetical protein
MPGAIEDGQRIYLRGGHEGDPLAFSVRWFVPAGFEADGSSEIQSVAHGKEELLGVSALAVMVGDVIDGTPVFETRPCTALAATDHILRECQRTRGIAYSQTVWVDATPAEVYRRMRLWESARERWAR